MIHVVLFQPEIPQNSGNIIRTCVALNATLHLVKPLGFQVTDKHLKRSGIDYYDEIRILVYESDNDFFTKNDGEFYFLSRYGRNIYSDVDYKQATKDIYLCFGSETNGINKSLLAKNIDRTFRIPTAEKVRSLNLSNCVALVAYEVYRQLDFIGLSKLEPESLRGKDYLLKYVEEKGE